jgi:hypothetical protein
MNTSAATKFATKTEAEAAIAKFGIPCACPVCVVPMLAKIMGVSAGWYIGFPLSISKEFVDISVYGG